MHSIILNWLKLKLIYEGHVSIFIIVFCKLVKWDRYFFMTNLIACSNNDDELELGCLRCPEKKSKLKT
jgi:hypothetical protein